MKPLPRYYPPSPPTVPDGLTKPSQRYRRQINTVSSALLMFFVVYFGLILFLVLLALVLFGTSMGPMRGPRAAAAVPKILLGLAVLGAAGFLIKTLFVRRKLAKGFEIEVFADEHPRLFRFLECVCEEVDAPMPERVYINCDVNAAAGSDISLGSLLRKNDRRIYLGLGLVNALNMTELKALLAHEFAHLSQHDSPSGPYVRLGMRVVGNILGQYRALQWVFMLVVKLNLKLFR